MGLGGEGEGWPAPAPLPLAKDEHLDNSVNAVSLGFIATAILISMFLIMAIFEKLRATSTDLSPSPIQPHNHLPKLPCPYYPSPPNATEVSVVMPGEKVPTFIAHPAPVPCPLERGPWPLHNPVYSE